MATHIICDICGERIEEDNNRRLIGAVPKDGIRLTVHLGHAQFGPTDSSVIISPEADNRNLHARCFRESVAAATQKGRWV